MSVLELKQARSRVSKRDRQELHAYLIRLKHETPEWKKAAARCVAEVKLRHRFNALWMLFARVFLISAWEGISLFILPRPS